MTDEQITHLVNRFLSWKLPEDFDPDCGIKFFKEYNVEWTASRGETPMIREPYGTNLLNAEQAADMVRYMLEGLPNAVSEVTPEAARRSSEKLNTFVGQALKKAATNVVGDDSTV